jgi:UrcA family protein
MNTITSASRHMLVASAILIALALSFSTASSAYAGTTPSQVIVKFADLDISSSQGAQALFRRIRSAAQSVCWRMYTGESNEAYKLNKDACLKKVIADAVTKVNQPALSAVFASKYGVSTSGVLAAAGAR